MNLTPSLQQEVEQLAISQGISPEQFILQAITEKVTVLHQQRISAPDRLEAQLVEKDGMLVSETELLVCQP